MRVKQRKGRQATDKQKIYSMHLRNRGDIDFEAERIEDHIFATTQGDQDDIPEDEHTEQPDLTLGNKECILRFPR